MLFRFGLLPVASLLTWPLSSQAPIVPPLVRPGAAGLHSTHQAPRIHDYRYLAKSVGDTAEHQTYQYHLEERLATIGGVRGLLIIKQSETPSYHFVDTLFIARRGLAPVWEHMQNQNATLTLRYDGPRVRLTRAVSDSAPRTSDTTYDVPVFAFNEQELVLRSLPLEAGFRALLPLYSEGSDSLEKDTVTVLGAKAPVAGSRAAWTVRFADPVIVETYIIDDQSRQIVSHEIVGRRTGGRVRVVE